MEPKYNEGDEVASPQTVAQYLFDMYDIDRVNAERLTTMYGDKIAAAATLGSWSYYVGDHIADFEKLEPREYPINAVFEENEECDDDNN